MKERYTRNLLTKDDIVVSTSRHHPCRLAASLLLSTITRHRMLLHLSDLLWRRRRPWPITTVSAVRRR